jgi:hypothetical protein
MKRAFESHLKMAILLSFVGVSFSGCASFNESLGRWFDQGPEGTEANETAVVKETETGRSPASVTSNPLRIQEYCVVDNFSRMGDCYPTVELCQKAARGFGMCSGR